MALNNIGNTCFINSVLQCLMNIDSLNNLEIINPEINESILTKEYYELRKLMKHKEYVISPNRFVEFIYRLTEIKKLDIKRREQNDVTEFLTFLIDCFHIASAKEIKISVNGTPVTPADHLLISSLKLYTDQSKNFSIILEIFYGVFVSTLCTLENKIIKQIPEMHFIIDLPIPDKKDLTIYDCLDEFVKDELLVNENAWYNDKTKQKEDVKKNIRFCVFPDILIFSFKRLNQINLKKNTMISVPFEINLKNYCAIPVKNTVFELKALCNHGGNAFGGHYNAYVKYKEWICFDDETTYPVPEEKVINPNIYCLIFHKKI
jgi:ubiquitin C-terminal hydrolase